MLIFLNCLLAIVCAIQMVTLKEVLRILLRVINGISTLVGLALIWVATVTATSGYGYTWSAYFVLSLGVVTLLMSMVGYQGATRESRGMLLCYFMSMLLVTVLLLIVGILAYLFLDQLGAYLEDNWQTVRKELPDPRMTQADVKDAAYSNIKSLFLLSLVVVAFLLTSLIATLLLRRQIKMKPPLDAQELAEQARLRQIRKQAQWLQLFPQQTKIPLPILKDTWCFMLAIFLLRAAKQATLVWAADVWQEPLSVRDTCLTFVEALVGLIIVGRFLYSGNFDVRVTLSLRPFTFRLMCLTLLMTLLLDCTLQSLLWQALTTSYRGNIHWWIRRTEFLNPGFWMPFWFFSQLISICSQMFIFFGVIMRGFSSRLRRLGSMLATTLAYALWQLEVADVAGSGLELL